MADEDATIYIDGTGYDIDDLTFREQREFRNLFRDLVEDPNADPGQGAGCDIMPVLAYIVRRRDDPEYTLERALDLKVADLLKPDPPTKPAAKRAAK